jgi:succinyl-diaminopimelate desuccinylase
MKGGVAVLAELARTVPEPAVDVTYVFYECEEIAAQYNGVERLFGERPELLVADAALLAEPTNAQIEAGCQGTMRAEVKATGVRAHSARAWKGVNAIHETSAILDRLTAYTPRRPEIDGLQYREGLNAVGISGGVAGNVLPDSCTVTVNYRFAPDRSMEEAAAHLVEVFDGYDVQVTDGAPGALPGLSRPAAAAFVEAVGGRANPKFGWTDVSRFSALGVPAVNFGPGDPELAHSQNEHVPLGQLTTCLEQLTAWLGPSGLG